MLELNTRAARILSLPTWVRRKGCNAALKSLRRILQTKALNPHITLLQTSAAIPSAWIARAYIQYSTHRELWHFRWLSGASFNPFVGLIVRSKKKTPQKSYPQGSVWRHVVSLLIFFCSFFYKAYIFYAAFSLFVQMWKEREHTLKKNKV